METIEQLLQDLRTEVLTKFVAQLMTTIHKQGFTFEELLNALTNWADTQQMPKDAIKALENACLQARFLDRETE